MLRSQVSSGSIVSDYGLDDWVIGVGSPARAKYFSSSLCVQTSSGAHPVTCPMGTGGKARQDCFTFCVCVMFSLLQNQSKGWSEGMQVQAVTVTTAQVVGRVRITVTWTTDTDTRRRRKCLAYIKSTGSTFYCLSILLSLSLSVFFPLSTEALLCQWCFQQSVGNFLTSQVTVSFWRKMCVRARACAHIREV
jgi:hypothetical protein